MAGENKHLGRGLSALLGEDEADYAQLDKLRVSKLVPIEFLHPGRYQPRHRIDEGQINDLAESIRQKGVLQPILVRRHPDDPNAFEIIAGERRWRASQLAELHEVPVIIKDLTDQDAMEIALVENLQRQDLSPLEEADGYKRLMEEFEHTQEKLAEAVGKSRSHVANMMRLLALPEPVKEMVDAGNLSAGHARALLNAEGDLVEIARTVVKRGLNVRQTEKLAKKGAAKPRKVKAAAGKDADTLALERDLSNILGLAVDIRFQGGGGTLTLHYNSLEQLDDILHRLTHGGDKKAPDEGAENNQEGDEAEGLSEAPLDLDETEGEGPTGPAEDDIDLESAPPAQPTTEEPEPQTASKPEPAKPAAPSDKDEDDETKNADGDDDFGTDWVHEAVRGEIDLDEDEDDEDDEDENRG